VRDDPSPGPSGHPLPASGARGNPLTLRRCPSPRLRGEGGRRPGEGLAILAITLLFAGCTLKSDVTIEPLFILPTQERFSSSSVRVLVDRGDFAKAVKLANEVVSAEEVSYKQLEALGEAELACGRFDDARQHLKQALDLRPFRTDAGAIAWSLSQLEYLTNNFGAALEWARYAIDRGTAVKQWHLDYLQSLQNTRVYEFSGEPSAQVRMEFGKPDVPRVNVEIEGTRTSGIIDSGAVLSIVAESLANELKVQPLGTFHGTFFGLLAEPIDVRFGLVKALQIGGVTVSNVPVAIMADKELRFVIRNKQAFAMRLILGANLLKEFRLEMDASKNEAVFTPLTAADRKPSDEQNLFHVGFRPYVHGSINHRAWYLFVLDTGSEVTFLNRDLLGKTPVRSAEKLHGATLQGLGGSQKHGAKIMKVEVGVDEWAGRFEDIPLYGTEHSQAFGIIGQDLLKKFRVVIDFGSMRVELSRHLSLFGG